MTESDIWPDPADWITRLSKTLVTLDLQYHGIVAIKKMKLDPDAIGNEELINDDPQASATLTAAGMIGAVVDALKEIPIFPRNVGLTGLIDLGQALQDADRGLRPALLQPRPGIVSPGDGSGRQLVKAHVVLCVELLELAGMSNSAARKAVSKIFSDNGFRGRKGGRDGKPLSPQTVYDWSVAMASDGTDRVGRQIIDRGITGWKAHRPWPPIAEDVLRYATECASGPELQTKT